MKKIVSVFCFLLLIGTTVKAQTNTTTVFNKDVVRNTPGEVTPPVFVTEGGREINRKYLKSKGELPYSVMAKPVKVILKVTESQNMIDDTTFSDIYQHTWSIWITDDQNRRIILSAGVTGLGAVSTYQEDISMFLPAINGDSCQITYRMDTWSAGSHYITVALEFTPDPAASVPFWLEPLLVNQAGVSSEVKDARWEKKGLVVPADIKDRNILYWGAGTGDYQFKDVDVILSIDGKTVYTISPWVSDCKYTWANNNKYKLFGVDSNWVVAGRTGWCYGGFMKRGNVSGDIFNKALTPGLHTVRFEPQLWDPTKWSDFRSHAAIYGSLDAAAGTTAKAEAVAEKNLGVISTGKKLIYTLYFQNASGLPMASTVANFELTSDDKVLFSEDGTSWKNPLTFKQKGASRTLYMKASTSGSHTINYKDLDGKINNIAPTIVNLKENLACTATAWAADSCGAAEAPKYIIDGDIRTKWCSNHQTPPYDLKLGWKSPVKFDNVVMYNGGLNEDPKYNTVDADIYAFDHDKKSWVLFAQLKDNYPDERGNIVVLYKKDGINADSLKLTINAPESGTGSVARIPELECYFAGTQLTSVKSSVNTLPNDFKVMDNYPNPFNPSTTIEFFTPSHAQVYVGIYNLLGQEVSRLISGEVPAGTHKMQWNATNSAGAKVAGGVYFYTVRFKDDMGRDFTISKKMLLLP